MSDLYNEKGFSNHGRSFQEKLVYAILTDNKFANRIGEVIKSNYLEIKHLQLIANTIFEYKAEHKTHPTATAISTIIRTSNENISDSIKDSIRQFFVKYFKEKTDLSDIDFVKQTAIAFCRKQAVMVSLAKCVECAETFSFDEIESEIKETLRLGVDNNVGHDFIDDFEERYIEKNRKAITTGWEDIDDLTNGGLGRGELGIVIGGTGMGKSMVLVHLGAKALIAGKNVVYYTLELGEHQIGKRFDACITGYPINDLKHYKQIVRNKLSGIEGRLIIKQYPSGFASTMTLKNHLSKMKSLGIDIDMIIVDYGDLLKATHSYGAKRHELEEIYTELRGIAIEYDCPLWTASQSNRDSVQNGSSFISMEGISEAYSKNFAADFVMTIKRTAEDKMANLGTLFIAKNREGYDGIVFPIFIDTSKVCIEVLNQLKNGEEDKRDIKVLIEEAKEKFKEQKQKRKEELK